MGSIIVLQGLQLNIDSGEVSKLQQRLQRERSQKALKRVEDDVRTLRETGRGKGILRSILGSTRSSIIGDEVFSFDQELVNTEVYRQTLRSHQSRNQLAATGPAASNQALYNLDIPSQKRYFSPVQSPIVELPEDTEKDWLPARLFWPKPFRNIHNGIRRRLDAHRLGVDTRFLQYPANLWSQAHGPDHILKRGSPQIQSLASTWMGIFTARLNSNAPSVLTVMVALLIFWLSLGDEPKIVWYIEKIRNGILTSFNLFSIVFSIPSNPVAIVLSAFCLSFIYIAIAISISFAFRSRTQNAWYNKVFSGISLTRLPAWWKRLSFQSWTKTFMLRPGQNIFAIVTTAIALSIIWLSLGDDPPIVWYIEQVRNNISSSSLVSRTNYSSYDIDMSFNTLQEP
jgi:hypothetical protein